MQRGIGYREQEGTGTGYRVQRGIGYREQEGTSTGGARRGTGYRVQADAAVVRHAGLAPADPQRGVCNPNAAHRTDPNMDPRMAGRAGHSAAQGTGHDAYDGVQDTGHDAWQSLADVGVAGGGGFGAQCGPERCMPMCIHVHSVVQRGACPCASMCALCTMHVHMHMQVPLRRELTRMLAHVHMHMQVPLRRELTRMLAHVHDRAHAGASSTA